MLYIQYYATLSYLQVTVMHSLLNGELESNFAMKFCHSNLYG